MARHAGAIQKLINAARLIRPISAHSLPAIEVMFGGRRWLCCRIRNVRMQAFVGDRQGLLPTRFRHVPNTSISNGKRMNPSPPLECLNTRHWPVFNDQGGFAPGTGSPARPRSEMGTTCQLGLLPSGRLTVRIKRQPSRFSSREYPVGHAPSPPVDALQEICGLC